MRRVSTQNKAGRVRKQWIARALATLATYPKSSESVAGAVPSGSVSDSLSRYVPVEPEAPLLATVGS